MYSEFDHRIAVVSGAAQGIGYAISEQLQALGSRVIRLDKRFDAASSEDCRPLDVSDAAAVEQTINDIEHSIGAIDYFVSCAGILRMGSLLDSALQDWHDTFAVNTSGAFNLVRSIGRHMRRRQRGVMVAVGSNAASVPRMGMGSYAASKAALTQMMKCLGLELAADGVRCNLVAPGSTDTEMQRQLWTDASGPEQVIRGSLQTYRLGIPLQRIASPQQIAAVVIFLLSDQAAHITMENIIVDGGASLGC
jgi:2,3-dihydro-2,3-dihydroxybenzoate dehydrogenase